MAFANNINRDMTSADARAVAGQDSWSDIYPDDFDFDADPWEYLGDHRLFFDTQGQPHFARGKNPFSSTDLAQKLTSGEKDGLLARKASGDLGGAIRDTRGRYGEPKEWDHVVVGLTRAEAEALGPEGVKEWTRTVIGAMQESPAGDGKRQMLVTPIHDDTDNVHVQFLLHRIPVNETTKTAGASYELSRNSEAAGQMKQLNVALEAAGLPMIGDFRMGAFSVSEPRAISAEEMARGAERVKEAGGVTPPDMTTGPAPAQRERVSPDMRHLDSMLADAVKRQKEAEATATSAATAVAAAQHARAALEQYEAEVKARQAVEADLAISTATLEETQQALAKSSADLTEARSEIDNLVNQVAEAVAMTAEKIEQIEELTADKSQLSVELAQSIREVEQEQAGRRADAKAAAERESAIQAALEQEKADRQADAKAAADLEAVLQAEKAELAAALEQARTATQEVKDELQQERDTFLDRARAWAEEHVRGPLMAQIDTLKTELVEARKTFAAEMAEAQRTFMAQLKELTDSLRRPEASPAKRQFPAWAEKPFNRLSKSERAAAQKSLDAQIKSGRIAEDLPLDVYANGVHERWQQDQENNQNVRPKPNAPKT